MGNKLNSPSNKMSVRYSRPQKGGIAGPVHNAHPFVTNIKYNGSAETFRNLTTLSASKVFITPHIANLDGASKFSFTTYFKVNAIQAGSPVLYNMGYFDSAAVLQTFCSISGTTKLLQVSFGSSRSGTTVTQINVGTWYHLGVVFDGTQPDNITRFKIYINGVADALTFIGTIPSALITVVGPFTICTTTFTATPSNPTNSLSANITAMRLWTGRALSSADVLQDYNRGHVLNYSSLPLGLLTNLEASWDFVNQSLLEVDSTNNGHTLTNKNQVQWSSIVP